MVRTLNLLGSCGRRGFFLLLMVFSFSEASAALPECSGDPSPLALRRIATPLDVSATAPNVYSTASMDIVVEAQFDLKRRPVCASVLAGNSYYWPSMFSLLESGSVGNPGAHEVLIFNDPGAELLADRGESRSCLTSDDVSTASRLGYLGIRRHRDAEADSCVDLVLRLAPASASAEYNAAVTSALLGNMAAQIEHYRRASELLPSFWDARLALGIAQEHKGDAAAADETFKRILAESPPLPIQSQTYYRLVFLFTEQHRRVDAASAQREYVHAREQLHRRYRPIASEWDLAFENEKLGALEEEVGEYQSAVKHFEEGLRWASGTKLGGESMRFHEDLGRLRSMRKIGRESEWRAGCETWHRRLTALSLRILTRELEDIDWGGKAVAQADWEVACGNFNKGLDLLGAAMKQRTPHPYSSSEPADTFFAEAPYLALERTYRSRGRSDLGDKAEELRKRISSANGDPALLAGILSEAEELVRSGTALPAN